MDRQIKFSHLEFFIWSFVGIFLLALFVRIYKLGESPRSVNWDEAALGYNSYSLLKTGHDEFGKYFPLSLQSFDDYKPALYAYFAVLPIAIFDVNDVSIRLPSAIFGSLLTITLGVLTVKITRNLKLGMITGILLALEPWAIHFSRIAFEANLGMTLLYVAIAAILSFSSPFVGIVIGILSMYAYHAQRLIALPIIFVLILLKYRGKISLTTGLHIISLTGILLIPLGINFFSQPITARFNSTSILKLAPFVPIEYLGEYSEWISLTNQIVGRYLAYFSPTNLFVRGSNEPVLRISTQGLLNSVEFVFIAVGSIYFLRNWKKYIFIIPILLISPLAGVITLNWFSVVRTLTLYPMFSFITALGLQKFNKLVFIVFVPFWIYTISNEISYLPVENYGEFQPGFEESVPYVLENGKNYRQIIVDSPQAAKYIFYNFYGKIDPSINITKLTERNSNAGTENNYEMGKIIFRKISFEKDSQDEGLLLVGTPDSIKDGLPHIRDFYDPKGYVSVRVYDPKKE